MKIPIAKLLPESQDPCHTVYEFQVLGQYFEHATVENNTLYLIKDFPHKEASYEFVINMFDPMFKNPPITKTYTITYKCIPDSIKSDLIVTTTPY